MDRNEFVAAWRDRLAGLALRGLVQDTDQRPIGPGTAGAYALRIPELIDSLLGRMYDQLARSLDKPLPVNGTTPRKAAP